MSHGPVQSGNADKFAADEGQCTLFVPAAKWINRNLNQLKILTLVLATFSFIHRLNCRAAPGSSRTKGTGYRWTVGNIASHDHINHSKGEQVLGKVHTNTVEGFFLILSAACSARTST